MKQVFTKISSMVAKLAPVLRRIDFFKSTATVMTFEGELFRSRMVTHYVSPEERQAPPPGDAPAQQ